ncbi:MAG TPA: aldehyde ferredoxin oxidoreductase N-terminal domain-containing protein, partial [Anaerolineaceae bacterium]|nr:aldehyde ferredoxin oxidoreductase N-terminal domain-containing protein [Anaerolineaceae bacterium]
MQIWRIDLQNQTLQQSLVPPAWNRLGGRGLSARILLDEIDPACDPLSPGNALVFSPGLLVGHMLSSCDRISIGGKSPLTQGIKESNAGGTTGLHLARLGIKALILKNHAKSEWWILHLSINGVRFDHADEIVGMGAYQSAQWLIEHYGSQNAMALIGPGGERQLRSAGILNLDQEGSPTRISARGGLGAVMGAMRLKAIVIDSQGGEKTDLVDEQAFRKAQKAFVEALIAHPQTAIYRDYGTAGVAA